MCDRAPLVNDDEPPSDFPHYEIPEAIAAQVLDLMHTMGRESYNEMALTDRLLHAKGLTPFKPDKLYVIGLSPTARLAFGWMQHHGQWLHVTEPQWRSIRPAEAQLNAALALWHYRTGCGALIGTGARDPGHNTPAIKIK